MNNRIFLSVWILLLILLLVLSGCSAQKGPERLFIMSWNVQNLFDDIDNGTEYREFDPENGTWTYDDFTRKAAALADVIAAAVPGGPDIIIFQEVENENALLHLNDNYLKSCGYQYNLFLPTEDSAVGCAVLSRIPVVQASSHGVNALGEDAGRNISAVHLYSSVINFNMHLFVNHWKSKLGGAAETEFRRKAASSRLNQLMNAAAGEDAGALLLAAGDFNESHDEFVRNSGAYTTAIMPADDPLSADEPAALLYTRSPEDLCSRSGRQIFYSPWDDSTLPGSYFYNNEWQTIDNFFLGEGFFNGSGWEYDCFWVAATAFNTTESGLPLEWSVSRAAGCSDHLPVIIELIRCE